MQISGQPPSLLNPPRGCRFHPRCPYVMDICKTQDPELRSTAGQPNHRNACHLDQETKDRESAKLLAEMPDGGRLMANDLLVVEDLKKHFPVTRGIIFQKQIGAVQAVDGVSFTVREGETLGVVGESGCGKSTHGPLRHAAARADRRQGRSSTAATSRSSRGRRCARTAAR